MLKISNIRVGISEELSKELIAKSFPINPNKIKSFKLSRKSVDARKKSDIHYNCSVLVEVDNENEYLKYKNVSKYEEFDYKIPSTLKDSRTIIVGCGPAGLFAGLYLAYAGQKPIIIERGSDVDTRVQLVEKFWNNGDFSPLSNVQFGEGGAGAFSDGKLTTGVSDERMDFIKKQLVKFGAPEDILYLSKPHIGTDKLRNTVKNIRNEIIRLGGTVKFNTKLCDIEFSNNKVTRIKVIENNQENVYECDNLILAIGHSARDTFKMLKDKGIKMERKPFSVGGRIEHLQSEIGMAQYGIEYEKLPPADYKLSIRTKDKRGVYTFCMCPGGYVVASASEEETVVTNGMSYYSRDGENANSALLVTVNPEDIDGDDVLGGIYFQKEIEEKAFIKGGKNYFAPIQKVEDFLKDKNSEFFGKVKPTYLPGTKFVKINEILPEFITDAMKEAILLLDKKLKGFASPDALITVPETRSSSPVRILRNPDSFESYINGLYPCGEGAGYAGGIMSAALDGIRCSEALVKKYT